MEVLSFMAAIGGYFVDPIGKHCGYLIHYKSNIKNLEDRIGNLQANIDGVQLKIDAAKRNGQVILPVVERWVEKARNILDEDAETNKKCLDGWCPRYSLSRKAKKKTLEIDVLLNNGQFSEVSSPPPPLGVGSSSIEGILDFESRTKMRREVLEALRADKVNVIAICGMGGIGKTTMAKEVAKRAKDDKLFDEVVMVEVSQNQDLRRIQVQIAEMLGLQLVEENPLVRAERLKNRLSMDSKSVLVILDDVWDALDLEAVGIPYGGEHNRCKILLTSRSEEACTQMKSQKNFPIKLLSEEEAWNLFREMAGNCIDTPSLHPIAREVAKECGGLPIAIVTVGRALENKGNDEWIAALQQLKKSVPKNIRGLHPKVYSRIGFSYEYLESDEAKSCFLLCCLFPEDYDIPIEFLVRHGVGQRLFAKIDTMEEARNRVHAIVKNLKRSFLLLDSVRGEQFVKMHDVVRDVAISIAEKENHGFLVRCNEKMEEWPEKDSCERSTAISLVSKELKRHPDGLECPKLELLQLATTININWYYTIIRHQRPHPLLLPLSPPLLLPLPLPLPPNLFKGMKGLKVLSLFGMSFPSLPQSINVLKNLRTLQFAHCEITDVSAIGELRNLEILSFLNCKIKELPGEMRNLSCLKLLELTNCRDLERIPPDLLSSLSRLEELYMIGGRVKWKRMEEVDEEEEEEKKGANASLTELTSLHNLVVLKIQIPNIKVLPKDLPFKNEMIKFLIATEWDEFYNINDYLFKSSLQLARCDASDIVESPALLQLLKKSEILKLDEIKDIKNIAYELDNEGFQCLKVLEVARSEDVEYVMDATSDQNPRAAFLTLESLHLRKLPNLKEIFDLEGLKANKDHQRIAVLAQLKTLVVQDLSKLTYLWKNVPLGIQGFQKLTSIFVLSCHRLRYLFPTSIAKLLLQLQSIEIFICDEIENIVQRDGEEEATDIILFPRVRSLRLQLLPKMMSFCIEAYSFELSSIKEIYLADCPELKPIFSEIQSPRKSKEISRELDSRPNEQELGSPGFHWRCLECVPRRKNYGLMAVSDQGTTNKSQKNYSVKEEVILSKTKDPKVGDSNNPLDIRSLFPSHIIECLKNLESIELTDVRSPEVIFQLEELNVEESLMAPVLDQLRNLILRGLDNMMHIWKKGSERILGFGNLRLLKVSRCDSLTYLFSSSIAKLLVMLEKIEVGNCKKIEEILARAGEEEKEKDVLFDKVNSIVLRNLPNLKCFCSETNALQWPSLEEITVKECPNLSTFIPSNLDTPKLKAVYHEEENPFVLQKRGTPYWKGELNATIEHIFKGKEKQANHETEQEDDSEQEEQIETIE